MIRFCQSYPVPWYMFILESIIIVNGNCFCLGECFFGRNSVLRYALEGFSKGFRTSSVMPDLRDQ